MLALTRGESGLLEIRDYLRILRRNWVLIIALSLIGVLAAGLSSMLVKPTYTAESELFVAIQGSGSVQELAQGNTFSQARVQSYVKTVTTPTVLQPVIDSLGLSTTPAALAAKVKASTDINTVLIKISVDDHSPVEAAALAQGISNSLVHVVDDLEKPKEGGTSPVKLSVVTPAIAPTSPSAPNTRLDLLLGLLGGTAVGIAAAGLRTVLDSRIRNEEGLQRITNSPVLGRISFDQEASTKPLITQTAAKSSRPEAFRQLRTNLQFAQINNKSKTLLVSSSLPGEGKSTTATNLAISMAQAGQSVVLIDGDLRRPMIDEYLNLERNAGLTTALLGQADINDLLQPWGNDDLYVLTSGSIPPNPSELLGSEAMKQLIVRLEHAFDAVIIDAPPLLPVTDAAVLAQFVGGVVLVVGSRRIKEADLQKSIRALQLVDANIMGLVVNRLPAKGPDAYQYTYYSYEAEKNPVRKSPSNRRSPRTISNRSSRGGSSIASATSAPLTEEHPESFDDFYEQTPRGPRSFPYARVNNIDPL